MKRLVRIAILAGIVTLAVACAGPASSGSSTSGSSTSSPSRSGGASTPQQTTKKETKLVKVDPATAERLQNAMVPLLKVMDHPLQPNQVKVGVMEDNAINAASAGNAEFLVTTGLLKQANDTQLQSVLAHELAHQDLNHVQKTQTLGTGLNIGMILLDQIIPGSGNLTPIAGELLLRKYSRNEEYAADKHGVQLLQRAGYPGRQMMSDTLSWLMQSSGGSSGGGFLATHPGTTDRVAAVKALPGP
jgi:Zn-dependent protease with chaperone function